MQFFSRTAPQFFVHHDSPSNLAESRSRLDYLVNHDEKKKGPFGGKIAQKSRNSCRLNGRSCGCIGTLDSRRNFAQSWNQIQRLKKYLCCYIYCAQLCTHLRAIVTASCAVSDWESRYPPGTSILLVKSWNWKSKNFCAINCRFRPFLPRLPTWDRKGAKSYKLATSLLNVLY